jgi:hypothetical protein
MIVWIVALFLSVVPATQGGDPAAQVAASAGLEAWGSVKVLRFTVSTGRALEVTSVIRYEYDKANEKVTLRDSEKTVTIFLKQSPTTDDDKWAFSRWRRDSIWMLLPIQLVDPGAKVERKPDVLVDGRAMQLLHVKLMDSREFDLYINPSSAQIEVSIERLSENRNIRFTWDTYRQVEAMRFSTSHDGPGRKITLSEIQVER